MAIGTHSPAPPPGAPRAPDLTPSGWARLRWDAVMVARQYEYWRAVHRRTWRGAAVSSFVTPLLYVLAMGVLLGGFVDSGGADLEGAPSYLAFVVPGLVAGHAMTTAAGECTWPVLGRIKWDKAYWGMIATPLTIGHVVAAHLVYLMVRLAISCGAFVLMMLPFGLMGSVLDAVLVLLVQVLVGLAFATPLFGWSAAQEDPSTFSLVFRLVVSPLFLLSGAFFPVANLGAGAQWLAWVTPLWHGVDLTRMIALGTLSPGLALVHLAYLATLAGLGWWWSVRRLRARMLT